MSGLTTCGREISTHSSTEKKSCAKMWAFETQRAPIISYSLHYFARETIANMGLGYLPGGHLPPPRFGHLPPPNSDISHPPKKILARRTTATPNFFFFFWRTFLSFFDLQLMEDIKDGKEEVLDEVVMEYIK